MRTVTPQRPPSDEQDHHESSPLGYALVGCGCGSAFLIGGLLPLLAATGLLPNSEGFFGETPPWIVVVAGIPFILVGFYFLSLALGALGSHPSTEVPRWLADTILFFLIIPFHVWLLSGRSVVRSKQSIGLPLGWRLVLRGGEPLLLAKIVVGILVFIVDLYLLSEVLGLGWFIRARPE